MLSPKERRKAARSTHTEAKPPRSLEERLEERAAKRRANAAERRR